jgi:hypothetical protein
MIPMRASNSMTTPTPDWEEHLNHLFDAELQFRLTAAVRIAVTGHRQPLDFPDVWTYAHVSVTYEELALRQEQAEYAAQLIQHSATLTMALAVKDAIEAVIPELPDAVRRDGNRILQAVEDAIANSASKPWNVTEHQVATAYHISRLIRNAYAHAPFAPQWMINRHIQDTTFTIPDVIELNTRGLHGNGFDWRHYGGLLALYKLCRFTRFEILGDEHRARTNIPPRQRTLYQLGDMIMEQIDEIPDGYVPASVEPNPDGSIELGHGYQIRPRRSEDADEQNVAHGAAGRAES